MNPAREALLALHASVVLFGITALFAKIIALSALEITLLRSIFAPAAIALYILWRGETLRLLAWRDYALALLLGVLLAAHWVTYFHSMQVSTVAIGVIALFTFPVMTVFIEPLFHGERLRAHDVASALVVLLGVYLLVPRFALDDAVMQGVLWGLLSALLYAMRNVVQRRYFRHYPARHALFYQTVVVFLVLLPFGGGITPEVTTLQWWQLALLGVLLTALPHVLFAHSLLHFPAKTASLISCMQVLYATLFAALLLGEWPGYSTVAGGILVVGAAMFESYMAGRRGAAPRPAP